MKKREILILSPLKGDGGSVIVLAMIMLLVVTIIGVSSINTTTTETTIAGNERLYNISFYAAEAARGYVPPHTALYHGDNVIIGGELSFPSDDGVDNDGDGDIDEQGEMFRLSSNNSSFDGSVEYTGRSQPPRASGYEANKFTAHTYEITCNGYSSDNTETTIESGFYRIGF